MGNRRRSCRNSLPGRNGFPCDVACWKLILTPDLADLRRRKRRAALDRKGIASSCAYSRQKTHKAPDSVLVPVRIRGIDRLGAVLAGDERIGTLEEYCGPGIYWSCPTHLVSGIRMDPLFETPTSGGHWNKPLIGIGGGQKNLPRGNN